MMMKYLSNWVANGVAYNQHDLHEPNKICAHSKSVSSTYSLGNNLTRRNQESANPCK